MGQLQADQAGELLKIVAAAEMSALANFQLEVGVRLFETELVGSALVHGGEVGPEGGILGFLTAVAGCLAVLAYGRWTGEGLQVDLADRPADGDRRFDGEA